MTWPVYVFVIIFFILILYWCRVTLVFAIKRNITIFYFKGLAAFIIVLETKALKFAKKFVNANLVQVLLIAHHWFNMRFIITTTNRNAVDTSFPILIYSKEIRLLRYFFKESMRDLFV